MGDGNELAAAAQKVRAAIERGEKHGFLRLAGVATPSRFNLLIPIKNRRILAYNSLSAGFALWDEADLAMYQSLADRLLPMSAPELKEFIPGGFIVSSEVDELEKLKRHYNAVRFNSVIMNLTIVPTLNCNFGCDYCFQGSAKQSRHMGKEVQEAIMAHVRSSIPALKRLHVTWYGGEPTLNLKLVMEMSRRLIEECKSAKIHYQAFMVTNGYLLSLEQARQLLSVGVNTLQVTLDGPQRFHDERRALKSGEPTYERIVANLKEIMAANIPLTIMVRVNIDERNRSAIPELLDDLADRGLGNSSKFRVYFAPVRASTIGCHSCSDVTLLNRDYGLFEAKMYDYAITKKLTPLPYPPRLLGNCQAVRPKGMIVLPDGQLHKCWDTVSYPELGVGSIFATDLFPDDPQHKRWLDWTPFNNEACLKCTLLPSCMGFCAYKHLFSELTRGEAGSIPCPSWKYNVNERLFLRARWRGFVKEEDWDPEFSPTTVMDGDIPLKSASVNDSEQITVSGPAAKKSRTKCGLQSVDPGKGTKPKRR